MIEKNKIENVWFIDDNELKNANKIVTKINYKGQEIVVASKRLADALSKLTEQRRNVLFLYFFFGYTDAQIGKVYGRNRSTANYWKLAALKQLRKEMERLEHEEQEVDTF